MYQNLSTPFLFCKKRGTHLFIFLCLSLFTLTAASASVIIVPTDHTTIQAAVNSANPGDIIVVENGIYNEAVNINSMGTPGDITIKSQNASLATVNGGVNSAFSASSFNGNITISGFNLDRDICNCSGKNGKGVLRFTNISGRVMLQNNDFVDGYGNRAIYLNAGGSVVMSAMVYSNTSTTTDGSGDNSDFLFAKAEGNSTLDLTASNNTILGLEDDGISILVDDDANFTANIFQNIIGEFTGSGSAIELIVGRYSSTGASVNVSIHENEIYDVIKRGGIAMQVAGSNSIFNFLIKNNELTDIKGKGFSFITRSSTSAATVRGIVEGNSFFSSSKEGIEVEVETDPNKLPSVYHLAIQNNTLSETGGKASIYIDGNDTSDPNFTCNIDLRNNLVTNPKVAAYRLDQSTTSIVNLEQAASTSTDPATVLVDNGNIGEPIIINNNISVLVDAVNDDNIPANIGDFVWEDLDENGIIGPEELGIEMVHFNITGSQNVGGAISRSTISDEQGNYHFACLLPGEYIISLTPSSEYPNLTTMDQGEDDTLDSDFDPTTMKTESISLIGGAGDNLNIDAGFNVDPLPVELISFSAKKEKEQVFLEWSTASELNNDHFVIEHSIDGFHFTEIGKVLGAGDSYSISNYHFIHSNPIQGKNYYRLQQIDLDRSFSYSNIVSVSFNSHQFAVNVYPNPFADLIQLSLSQSFNKDIMIEVYDQLGQLIHVDHMLKDLAIKKIDLSSLMPGVYVLRISDGNQTVSQRVVKFR